MADYSPGTTSTASASGSPYVVGGASRPPYVLPDPDVQDFTTEWDYTEGPLYEDPDFPPNDDALYDLNEDPDIPDGANKCTQWLRPSQMCDDPKLFKDGIMAGDVVQGGLGNCWFLGAISVISTRLELIDHLFAYCAPKKGLYKVRFYTEGYWHVITVDDRIPCSSAGVPVFSRCHDHDEFWVPILEKAYAKLHGTYQSLGSGLLRDALVDMTGGIAGSILIADHPHYSTELWDLMVEYRVEEGRLMGCSVKGDGEGELGSTGLLQQHAYAILHMQEVTGGHKLIKLRNVWGTHEWTGAWSDGAPEWTPALEAEISHVNEDDGVFWMEFNEFCHHFEVIDLCKRYNDPHDKSLFGKYHSITVKDAWRGRTASGVFINNPRDCPQYLLSLPSEGKTTFALRQKDARFAGDDKFANVLMGFHLLRTATGERIAKYNRDDVVAVTDPWRDVREVFATVDLPAGDYIFAPTSYAPGDESDFVFRVYSTTPGFSILQLPPFHDEHDHRIVNSGWTAETAGGCANFYTWVDNPQFMLNLTGSSTGAVPVKITLRQDSVAPAHSNLYILPGSAHSHPCFDMTPVVEPGKFVNYPEAVTIAELSPSTTPYVVVPCTFHQGVVGTFTLSVAIPKAVTNTVSVSLDPITPWNRSQFNGTWTAANAGGCNNFDTWGINTRYGFTLPAATRCIFAVAQDKAQRLGIGFLVCKGTSDEVVAQCENWSRGPWNHCETTLEAGTYAFIPTTFNPNQTGSFVARIYSEGSHVLSS